MSPTIFVSVISTPRCEDRGNKMSSAVQAPPPERAARFIYNKMRALLPE